jgi:hypothetical protein
MNLEELLSPFDQTILWESYGAPWYEYMATYYFFLLDESDYNTDPAEHRLFYQFVGRFAKHVFLAHPHMRIDSNCTKCTAFENMLSFD